MSEATKRLLDKQHPDLSSRSNVHALKYGETWQFGPDSQVRILSSDHMLGAGQVEVTLSSGQKLGYSGDFCWPLDDVIQVDELVVDATYGNPDSERNYSQEDAQEAFASLVRDRLRLGPVHLMADGGIAERGMHVVCLAEIALGIPIIVGKKLEWSIQVHGEYGLEMPPVIVEGTPDALDAMADDSYIRVIGLHSRAYNDALYGGTSIKLTKYRAIEDPVEETSDGQFTVGLCSHADFSGTLAYVKATGASKVVTDNVRGHRNERAETLARIIRTQLGISARMSSDTQSREWGR
jgi:hypothetical protein